MVIGDIALPLDAKRAPYRLLHVSRCELRQFGGMSHSPISIAPHRQTYCMTVRASLSADRDSMSTVGDTYGKIGGYARSEVRDFKQSHPFSRLLSNAPSRLPRCRRQ